MRVTRPALLTFVAFLGFSVLVPGALAQQGPTFARDYVYGPTGQVAVSIEPDAYGPFAPSQTEAALSGSCASDGVDVDWASTTDIGSGVSFYRVYRNGGWIADVSGTFYHDSNITALESYSYHTTAIDRAGNEGAASPESDSVSYDLCISGSLKLTNLFPAFSHVLLFGKPIKENRYASIFLPTVNTSIFRKPYKRRLMRQWSVTSRSMKQAMVNSREYAPSTGQDGGGVQ